MQRVLVTNTIAGAINPDCPCRKHVANSSKPTPIGDVDYQSMFEQDYAARQDALATEQLEIVNRSAVESKEEPVGISQGTAPWEFRRDW